jgi:alkyl sulfatase BDS1-like metallo-beta-lactamase superfamily hydrolase
VTPDVIAAMETGLILDYVAIRLRHAEAAELRTTVALVLSDIDERYVLELSNGVLHHRPWRDGTEVDVTVTLPRSRLNRLLDEVDIVTP